MAREAQDAVDQETQASPSLLSLGDDPLRHVLTFLSPADGRRGVGTAAKLFRAAASSTTSPHQHLLNRAAAGFVVVTNVSMDAQTLTLLAPCSGGLPSCHLLMGKLEWMESSYT